jgi:uncharacterized protein (DUF885 family)
MILLFDENIDKMEGISDTDKNDYKARNKEIVVNKIIPAYNKLIDELSSLKGSGKNEHGLCGFGDEGKKYYEYLVRTSTGSSHTVDELTELIETRIESQLSSVATSLQDDPSLVDAWASFSFPSSDPAEILTDLKSKITSDFPELPETTYALKYVNEALEAHTSPAFYLTPPIDRLTNNTIYINRSNTSPDTLYPTMAHEGYPGHMYQTIYFSSVCDIPLRHLYYYPGYSEGWATYVEYEAYAYADNTDSLNSLMKSNASITLAVYALLDININYNGWTQEDASEFIGAYFSGITPDIIDEIYYTMVEEPANYLKYYVGYLEILLLREEAEETLGNKFNLKDFHTFLLDMGDSSFETIHNHMKKWMDSY